ncbi:MAG TPA: FKBP-type peptidyl-prolyl cis-trans isomerase [Chitinophaga sp.]|uniref:FKBP-type peptidyl-prolyl cis-trans isomerase n=1 Tax=Chitinophaga sp. TaxID=1869181 RepID=UPI002BDBE27F|nr:FKBP-type peptidyl-prolyl cis-trans isomerase [Chitinophaga sp.]HVI44357.1 FKBP-type peptidyl-prolyl cis-trans isomerase [Chitinophaga sp.]
MNQIIRVLTVCLFILLSACSKKEDSSALLLESDAASNDIASYLFARQESAQRDPSGVYYQIINIGDQVRRATPTSVPVLKYTYELIDGRTVATSFDATDFGGRQLKDHIPGWQVGLTKIYKGGKIRLFIPPAMAFGSIGVPLLVPPNAILISTLELVDIR